MIANPAGIRTARRVCFFAHFNPAAAVADYVWSYLEALRATGFTTVFISTSSLSPASVSRLQGLVADILIRENTGLDFGGWVEACRTYFPLDADLLLLANDSVYLMTERFGDFLDQLLKDDADFYGAVESGERGKHLQSWFLLFRPSAYRSDAFRSLMLEPMPTLASKAALIERYEIGLSQRLAASGLQYCAAFSPLRGGSLARARPYNAMHLLWDEVLLAGVPFVKAELLRSNPLRALPEHGWRSTIGACSATVLPSIDRDLQGRGRLPTPTRLALTQTPAINWPEVRFLVRRDFRMPARWPIHLVAYRAIIALAAPIRRMLQRRLG